MRSMREVVRPDINNSTIEKVRYRFLHVDAFMPVRLHFYGPILTKLAETRMHIIDECAYQSLRRL